MKQISKGVPHMRGDEPMGYTKGPWTYEKRRSDEYLVKGPTGCGYIATVYAAMVGTDIFESNARLIAAAPDLLELAHKMKVWAVHAKSGGKVNWIEVQRQILETIAKAEPK